MNKRAQEAMAAITRRLQDRYAQADAAPPLALMEEPTQIVFTGLEPAAKTPQRDPLPALAGLGPPAPPAPPLPPALGAASPAAPDAGGRLGDLLLVDDD